MAYSQIKTELSDQLQFKRNRLYKLLQIGKRDLSWDEDTYRAVLEKHGASNKDGKVSATTMNLGQLNNALLQMRKAGFQPRATRAQKGVRVSSWKQARINKAYALWCALAAAGVVHNRSMKSLHSFAANYTKKPVIDWATGNELNQIIEGLKSWAVRERVDLR